MIKFADATNSAAATRYYPDSNGWAFQNWSTLNIQGYQAGGVTWTIEATNSAVGDSDAIWYDISKLFVDLNTGAAGAASWVDDASLMITANGLDVERIRIKEVTSDATNSVLGWARFSEAETAPAVTVAASALPSGAATAALQTTLNGYEAPGTWTPATAAAAADSGVISAAACTVRMLSYTNAHSAARYLHVFDSATVPADGTAPRVNGILCPATTTINVRFGNGLVCANGFSWASSSTQDTKTITADTKHVLSAELV